MKLQNYIKKKTILNLAFFLFLLGSAWLFDQYHADDIDFDVETEQTDQSEHAVLYFCNPGATLTLKAPVEKGFEKKLIQSEVARHLMFHHSARAFHLLKAEISDLHDKILARNLLAFRNHHFTNADDLPPSA